MILKCKNISKIYGEKETKTKALNNVSLNIKKGEFVAIIGPSGNGKSTLMHILGGVDTPSKGEVLIENVNLFSLTEEERTIFRRRQIGIIYQFYNLLPILNTKENILLPLELDNKKIDYKYFDELIKATNLEDKLENLPNQLSGGQKQRVSIVRALINKPTILLADEPTGNLDSKTSEDIMELLLYYNKKYKQTIIMITHDINLALKCDRIIKINNGKITTNEDLNNEN